MNEQEVRAMFLLADIPVVTLKRVENGYWPDVPEYKEVREASPWWIVETGFGEIEIGDRKKVVEIEWSGLGIVFPFIAPLEHSSSSDTHIVRDPNITTWETGSHAWGYGQAVSVLTSLRKTFSRHRFLNEYWAKNPHKEEDKENWLIIARRAHWATEGKDRIEIVIREANKTFALQEFYTKYPKYRVDVAALEEEILAARERTAMVG